MSRKLAMIAISTAATAVLVGALLSAGSHGVAFGAPDTASGTTSGTAEPPATSTATSTAPPSSSTAPAPTPSTTPSVKPAADGFRVNFDVWGKSRMAKLNSEITLNKGEFNSVLDSSGQLPDGRIPVSGDLK